MKMNNHKHPLITTDITATCLEEQKKHGGFHISKVSSFSSGTSTGNINRHLLDKHDLVVESTQSKIPQILNYIVKHTSAAAGSTQGDEILQHEFSRDVLMWFVRDLLAFENVAKQGMINFMKKIFRQ